MVADVFLTELELEDARRAAQEHVEVLDYVHYRHIAVAAMIRTGAGMSSRQRAPVWHNMSCVCDDCLGGDAIFYYNPGYRLPRSWEMFSQVSTSKP